MPAPGKGQVLVRVLAASVNSVDWHIRNGGFRLFTGRRFPRGMGGDFAGVVEQVGPGVTRLKAGDPMFGGLLPRPAGAFAEWAVADEKYVAKKPAGLSYPKAACLPTAGVTALQAVAGKGRLQARAERLHHRLPRRSRPDSRRDRDDARCFGRRQLSRHRKG